jgi:hypothetical protein
MTDGRTDDRNAVTFTLTVAGVLGVLAGGAAGHLASLAYELEGRPQVGVSLGAAIGLAAAAVWSFKYLRWARRGPEDRMVSMGAYFGFLVGIGSTIVLHTALLFITGLIFAFQIVILAIPVGMVAGIAAGAIGGFAYKKGIRSP